ncbi:MAG: hypothetical protein GVY10_02440 [Verrucomicrobia bacterium]|jgi:uncharacterized repeat protein (TIGR04138 family)|nr:hypothetical protein [Verrucomicrobiota bacterium]
MSANKFLEVVELIRKEDDRYASGAYVFVRQGLDSTLKGMRKREGGVMRHITGSELCEGIREYALEQFGPMARTLLEEWGVHRTEDFGEIVFNLVEYGIFGKTEEDSRADFRHVYSFEEAFSKPFQPRHSGRALDLTHGQGQR